MGSFLLSVVLDMGIFLENHGVRQL